MFTPQTATESDLAAVAALERRWSSEPWSEQGFYEFCRQKNAHLLVLYDKEKLIGYLALRNAADTGEIDTFAVAPEYRRRGAGRALLSFALDFAAKNGAAQVFLEVRESNESARSLYESLGFAVCGIRKRFYQNPTEDAILYQYDPETNCENPGH